MRGVEGAAPYVAAANRDACVEGDAHIDPFAGGRGRPPLQILSKVGAGW